MCIRDSVKPSNSGSSLGISKVKNQSELSQALEIAWKVDSRIVIEEGLDVREIECGIIGNSQLVTSEIGEVTYESEWYDYNSKYNSNNKITIPAAIDPKIGTLLPTISFAIFKVLALPSCQEI